MAFKLCGVRTKVKRLNKRRKVGVDLPSVRTEICKNGKDCPDKINLHSGQPIAGIIRVLARPPVILTIALARVTRGLCAPRARSKSSAGAVAPPRVGCASGREGGDFEWPFAAAVRTCRGGFGASAGTRPTGVYKCDGRGVLASGSHAACGRRPRRGRAGARPRMDDSCAPSGIAGPPADGTRGRTSAERCLSVDASGGALGAACDGGCLVADSSDCTLHVYGHSMHIEARAGVSRGCGPR